MRETGSIARRHRRFRPARLRHGAVAHLLGRLLVWRGGRVIGAAIVTFAHGRLSHVLRKHRTIRRNHGVRDAAGGERDNHKQGEPEAAPSRGART